MSENRTIKLAVLIDADNAQASLISELLAEVAKFGTASIKRAYGGTLEDEEEDVLVKTKTITPKPMDMEEAIMQMELIGHSFFVYRDTETDAISIVYRRNDGDYGLIETE